MSDLITSQQPLDDGFCVGLTGDIDLSRSPQLRQDLIQLTEQTPGRLVVDMTEVPYMDSSGVATLVEALQRQRKHNGKMVLCGLQPKVLSIFEIARLDMVFTIVEDLDAAKNA
ncbi:STAS domain-containing protein [Planctomycetales bacterium ZRK34]|nr:STAS domain-containing protein [Planctomycetales bacterium ZRK34]